MTTALDHARLVPWILLLIIQVFALGAILRELTGRLLTPGTVAAVALFALAVLTAGSALALGWHAGAFAYVVSVVAVVAALAAPLVWGWVIGEFHLSHHLIRASLLGRASCSTADMSLLIGEIARRSGVSHDTLRYYERIGLIPPPERDAGGRRRYRESVLDLLGVITTLRGGGFSLEQISRVLGAKVPGTSARQRVDALRGVVVDLEQDLRQRRAAVERALQVLDRVRAELAAGEPYSGEPLQC